VSGWQKTPGDRRRDNAVYNAEYRRKRLECLRRANWRCEIRLDGCQGAASECDHVEQAGNDPRHERLRAACKSCHGKVTARQGRGARAGQQADPEPRPKTDW
jgi:hypothetical protein